MAVICGMDNDYRGIHSRDCGGDMSDLVERLREEDQLNHEVKSNRAWREECESLRQQLEETQLRAESFEGSFNACEKQLAECQAREKVLHRQNEYFLIPEPPSDSTALDTMLKQAKRKALLEAANRLNPGYGDYEWRWVCDELRNMAKELE
jgi:hypothetical protein